MRARVVIFLIVLVSLVFGLLFARQLYMSRDLPRAAMADKKLRVLTYTSFASNSGPGPAILKRFKAETGMDVELIVAGDTGLLLERLKLAEASTPVDVVIGLDQISINDAQARFKWRELSLDRKPFAPEVRELGAPNFVPFDWSPLTFVYRAGDGEPPRSVDDLERNTFKQQFALQDPRNSSPGQQFFGWVQALKGPGTVEFLRNFKPNVNSVSPSWALAYGLFQKEKTKYVYSYVTSLAYHWGVDKDRRFQVVDFAEGHPVQVEFVGIPLSCRDCGLAEKFAQTLLQPWAQKLIMERNFMYPAVSGLTAGTVFAELPKLKTIPVKTAKDLHDWDQVFPR